MEEQRAILVLAASLVKSGGRLVYVTCSVLPEENGDQFAWFLANHSAFAALPWRESWAATIGTQPPMPAGVDKDEAGLLLTPARHGTDGFYVASARRQT